MAVSVGASGYIAKPVESGPDQEVRKLDEPVRRGRKNRNVLAIHVVAGRIKVADGTPGSQAVTLVSGHAVRFLVTLIGRSSIAFPAQWVRGIVTPAAAGLDGA